MHRIVSSIGIEVPRHHLGIGRVAVKDVSEMVRTDIQEAKSARHTTAHHDMMSGIALYHIANQLCFYASFDSSAHTRQEENMRINAKVTQEHTHLCLHSVA